MKRHHDHSHRKGWLEYSFRGSVHCHHDLEHGGVHVDTVLELRGLHPVGNRKSTETLAGLLSIGNI